MNNIEYYYNNFLGLNNINEKIVSCQNRDYILNNEFIYPLIFSKYNENKYFSISPKFYEKFIKFTNNKNVYDLKEEELIEIIEKFFIENYEKNFEIKKMYRMYNNSIKYNNSISLKLDINTKEYFMNTGKKAVDREYKEKKWLEFINGSYNEYSYFVPYNDKIASLAFVSNIYFNGANIVVSTDQQYRNKGYGKAVVASLCNSLTENEILPIYWVNIDNIPSIRLAKNLNFHTFAEEIVVCIKN